MIKTILLVFIGILYGIEIFLHEKDKKELKKFKDKYGGE